METIDTCLEDIDLDDHNAFEDDILYLRNMSSIGRRHPQERYFTQYLKTKYDVTVSIDKMWVFSLDYKALTDLFQFEGTELLIIDAEGSDYKIISQVDLKSSNIQLVAIETHDPNGNKLVDCDNIEQLFENHRYFINKRVGPTTLYAKKNN